MTTSQPTDPAGPTGQLSLWLSPLTLSDIPESIKTRAKYLLLDGVGCALVAALINGIFIQGFELDDWHSEAPLHSNSIVVPALFSAAAAQNHLSSSSQSGTRGWKLGPRVGNALHGGHILTMGWHSWAVFGASASATAVSKMFGLDAGAIEDALAIACTQACGLMSAQFESEVKRMQHGFAARNGLFAAFLAKGGYIGIKRVYERAYGGFLDIKDLGKMWKTEGVRVKPYAAMASYAWGCGLPERPLTSVGAQMSAAHVAATQIVDREVMPRQFRSGLEEREDGGGVNPELSNEEIVEKWRGLMNGVIDEKRRDEIEKTCLGIEEFDDVMELGTLLAGMMKNVIPQDSGDAGRFFRLTTIHKDGFLTVTKPGLYPGVDSSNAFTLKT
ncbi:hypothetical protein DL95DRAFT_428481 [Leptodontidium sp. 2 PMI_412]|nr:hypothetical protein DL95DRAFT_428481 [Leptodontidium sp. 2 PMI_412]